MKEPHIEGLATHDDPESCGGGREAVVEALTGARAGRVSSREIRYFGAPTPSREAEGNTGRAVTARYEPGSARSKTPSTYGTLLHENREIPMSPVGDGTAGRSGKVGDRTPEMYGMGKSDEPIVPMRRPNKAAQAEAEAAEGRGEAKGQRGEAKRGPDAEPEQSRAKRARPRA